ncbi:MAG: SCO1664 family protein [Chloroflexi bacterium]|nr:SCO1664 family protein [Chloroflexota bacterium]
MSEQHGGQSSLERRAAAPSPDPWSPESPEILKLLERAEITSCALLPWGSNYTFLATLDGGAAGPGQAVYKPRRGEAPLYDFPGGTLYLREVASYLVCQLLGWGFVPPTVVRREGPHGVGSLQLFVPSVEGANYFTFRDQRVAELQRIAAFDCLANNADRKGGHCLLGEDGRVWGIDHGLTFHQAPKLRTVIWEFQGTPIPQVLLSDMGQLLERLERKGELAGDLAELLSPGELQALCQRLEQLLEARRYPAPGPWRSVPWPRI